jgi:hypothetical protein
MYPLLSNLPPTWSFIGANYINGLSSQSQSAPSGVAVGDVLLYVYYNTGITTPVAAPSGFSSWYIYNQDFFNLNNLFTVSGSICGVYFKVVTNVSDVYIVDTITGLLTGAAMLCFRRTGVPIDTSDTFFTYDASFISPQTALAAPPYTASWGNVSAIKDGITILVAVVSNDTNNPDGFSCATPSGYTLIMNQNGSSYNNGLFAVFYRIESTTSNMNTVTSSITRVTGTGNHIWSTITLSCI